MTPSRPPRARAGAQVAAVHARCVRADEQMREATPIVLTLPLPPRLTNGSHLTGHWRGRHAQKVAYKAMLDGRQAAGLIPPPPARALPFAGIGAHLVVGGAMDDDNAMARCKWALDWLVTRGYLAGDSRRHLRWMALPTQAVRRKESPSLTITLTPLAP